MDKKTSPTDVASLAIELLKLQNCRFGDDTFSDHFRRASLNAIACLELADYLLSKHCEPNPNLTIKYFSDLDPFIS